MSRTRILMVNERMNNWNVLELGDAVFGQTWANHGKPFFGTKAFCCWHFLGHKWM